MEIDKIHKRVIEIQENIQNVSPEKQTEMLNELFNLASKIEQSLSDMKLDINDIEDLTEETE